MAFDKSDIAPTGGSLTSENVPISWSYISATDTLATIRASAYFNDWSIQLTKNDYLYIVGTDGADLVDVTSATGTQPVTVGAFISAGDIADGAVTLPKLAVGVSPSHVVKFGGSVTTTGGLPVEDFAVPGVLPSDHVVVVVRSEGIVPVTILESNTGTDDFGVEFSADPSNDTDITYMVFRAAV